MRDRWILFIGLLLLILTTANAIDTNAPVTTFTSFQVPSTTDQNITLTCTDNNTGCKTINYNIDNNIWVVNQTLNFLPNITAYYNFDSNTADILTDLAGGNNNGTNTNIVVDTNGILINHYNFNGSNSKVTLTTTGFSTTAQTISVWVKTNVTSGVIYSQGVYNSTNFDIADPSDVLCAVGKADSTAVKSGVNIANNNWHHIVCDWNGAGVSIWIDGVFKNSQATAPTLSTANQSIGSRGGTSEWFAGKVDEMLIAPRALSSTEISYLYNSGLARTYENDSNSYNFLFNGAGDHNIQYFSTDNADNNETTKLSYFPMIQTINDQTNSRIQLLAIPTYNNETITSWLWTIDGTPLSGTTDQNRYYSTQANLDLNICVTLNGTYSNCQNEITWDTISPTIDANIVNSAYGFTSTFDLNYNMICYDNFSPINYLITWNDGTTDYNLYNSNDANATLVTGTLDLNAGQDATLTFSCIDDTGNTTTYISSTIYALIFRLINENTGTLFDLNKVTAAQAYTYDGNFIYNFKDTNLTTTYFFSPTQTIRFDFTYPDESATKISREVNFDYLNDTNVGICVAEYQQFYLYRFLSTSVKPVIVYNDFAKCYTLASTTKFLYNTYQSNTAYTINKPYYLYTYTNGVKTLLALLDGANNTEINLDILAFNQTDYTFLVNTDVISFKPSDNELDSNTISFYFYSPNQNDSVKLQIYNGSTLLWTYTEFVDTNSFEVNFYYGDLGVTDTNLLKVVVSVVLDGETTSFYKYFNTKAESYAGLLKPIVAIVLSFFIMFFGLTMVSYRFAMGWFGLVISLICIGILALAPPNEYILFIQAIYLIMGVFIGIIGKEQNLGVSS